MTQLTLVSTRPSLASRTTLVFLFTMIAKTTSLTTYAAANAAAAAKAATTATTTVLPLIPHHVQKQRRLKQLEQETGLPQDPSIFDDDDDDDDHRPRSRRTEGALQVGALYHGYGTHYADVWVGTPPQRQTVIVDTGSSLTAFPCKGCNDCGAPNYHIDGYFDFDASSSFHKTACGDCQRGSCSSTDQQCKISMSYQEGSSWYAFESKDITYVGGPHMYALTKDEEEGEDIDPAYANHFAFDMTFGCQYKLTGLFKTQLADGIMGMENSKTSFWKQMHSAGKMGPSQTFSLCFSRPPEASKRGTEAGAMTFGGVETRLHATDMVYTDNGNGKSGFFGVKIRSMYLRHGAGGDSAKSASDSAKVLKLALSEGDLNAGGVIVDSGTTDTYFTRRISDLFRDAFHELSGQTFSHTSKELNAKQLAALPTILFQLYGDIPTNKAIASDANDVVGLAGNLDPDHPYDVILAIPPSHYMEQGSSGKYTARFYDTESSGSVLGANAMMGHDVMFDADNLVIGWAESNCDYQKLVTEGGYPDVLDGSGQVVTAIVDTNDDAPVVVDDDNTGGDDGVDAGGDVGAEDDAVDEDDGAEDDAVDDDEGAEDDAVGDDDGAEDDAVGDDDGAEDDAVDGDGEISVDPTEDGTVPDSQNKKDHPDTGSATHDEQSPVDDIKKAMNGFADACDTLVCRGGLGLVILLALGLLCYCGKCLLCGSKGRKYTRAHNTELELADTTFRDKGAYMDDFDDDEDAEYGEYATNKRIT